MIDESSFQIEERQIRLRRRSVKGTPKLCPRCLSQMHLQGSLSGWMLPEEFLCESCGYHGHVALEALPKKDNDSSK